MRVGTSALQSNYAKLVIAASRSDHQRDPLQERRAVRPIQFKGDASSDSEDESKNSSPDNFADYIVDVHA